MIDYFTKKTWMDAERTIFVFTERDASTAIVIKGSPEGQERATSTTLTFADHEWATLSYDFGETRWSGMSGAWKVTWRAGTPDQLDWDDGAGHTRTWLKA